MRAIEINRKAAQAWADAEEKEMRKPAPQKGTLSDGGSPTQSTGATKAGNPPPSYTIRSYFEWWMSDSKQYAAQLPWAVRLFFAFLGVEADEPLMKWSRNQVQGFIGWLRKKRLAHGNVNSYVSVLRTAGRLAVKEGLLLVCPVEKGDYLAKKTLFKREAFETHQINSLLQSTKQVDWITSIVLGYYAKLQLTGAISRRWDQVDLEKGTIIVPKNARVGAARLEGRAKECEIPIHPAARNYLQRCRDRAPEAKWITPSFQECDPHTVKVGFVNLMQGSGNAFEQVEFASGHKFFLEGFGSLAAAHLEHILKQIAEEEKNSSKPPEYWKQLRRIVKHLAEPDEDWMPVYTQLIATLPRLKIPLPPCLRD